MWKCLGGHAGAGRSQDGGPSAAVQSNITLVHADMRDFKLAHSFGLAFIAASSFCIALATAADQEATIRTIHRQFNKNGLLIVDTFDPNPVPSWRSPSGQNGSAVSHDGRLRRTERLIATDRLLQTRTTRPSSRSSPGRSRPSTVRYTYFYELQHVTRLCGFGIEALMQDYEGAPFSSPGGKLLVVAPRKGPRPVTVKALCTLQVRLSFLLSFRRLALAVAHRWATRTPHPSPSMHPTYKAGAPTGSDMPPTDVGLKESNSSWTAWLPHSGHCMGQAASRSFGVILSVTDFGALWFHGRQSRKEGMAR